MGLEIFLVIVTLWLRLHEPPIEPTRHINTYEVHGSPRNFPPPFPGTPK
jgi:hypothetical protein